MADPIEDLIREIAAKHGIAVSRDDPILILQTINTRLLQDSAKAQQVMLDQYKEELEALALRWGNDARDKAERILNASLAASRWRRSCRRVRGKRRLRCVAKSTLRWDGSSALWVMLDGSGP
jgi:cell division septum initiation protein DivIVA